MKSKSQTKPSIVFAHGLWAPASARRRPPPSGRTLPVLPAGIGRRLAFTDALSKRRGVVDCANKAHPNKKAMVTAEGAVFIVMVAS